MRDADCVALLQWALPRMNLRWTGFRKVRRQVCHRVGRRMRQLGIATADQYRDWLLRDKEEWWILDAACRITISRFYRDRDVFDRLGSDVLPALAQAARDDGRRVRCWCAGCASGEEAYTLAILWDRGVAAACAEVDFDIVASDADPTMIARAERACFSAGSLKDMPQEWLGQALEKSGSEYCVAARHRRRVTILAQDIRAEMPDGPFDLILCRNLILTYFDAALQALLLKRITARLTPGGYLVIGAHERLPQGDFGLEAIAGCREILRYAPDPGEMSEAS